MNLLLGPPSWSCFASLPLPQPAPSRPTPDHSLFPDQAESPTACVRPSQKATDQTLRTTLALHCRPTLSLVHHQRMLGFLGFPARCDRSAAHFRLIGNNASNGKESNNERSVLEPEKTQATESAMKPQKELGESTGVDIRRQRSSRATMDGMVGS